MQSIRIKVPIILGIVLLSGVFAYLFTLRHAGGVLPEPRPVVSEGPAHSSPYESNASTPEYLTEPERLARQVSELVARAQAPHATEEGHTQAIAYDNLHARIDRADVLLRRHGVQPLQLVDPGPGLRVHQEQLDTLRARLVELQHR